MISTLIKPYGTAQWLLDKTSVSFKQIAEFCKIDLLEILAMANGSIHHNANDPIMMNQLTYDDIKACELDHSKKLSLQSSSHNGNEVVKKHNKVTYFTLSQKRNKIAAIAWFAKNCPDIKRSKIAKLVGSTKITVDAIFDKTNPKFLSIVPKDPVQCDFCTNDQLKVLQSE